MMIRYLRSLSVSFRVAGSGFQVLREKEDIRRALDGSR